MMALLKNTVLLIFVNVCIIVNARVIETTTLGTRATTLAPSDQTTTLTSELPSYKTTTVTTQGTSLHGLPSNETTVQITEGTSKPALLSNETTTLTTEGTSSPLMPSNETTTMTAESTSSLLLPSSETTTLSTEGTSSPVLPLNETTTLTIEGTQNPEKTLNLTNITTEYPNATIPPVLENKILDLAFIMDTTGSMGSYIESARQNIRTLVDEIALNSSTDLRVALIEYRDHLPQEYSFVTRTHDFTTSVKTMKRWLEQSYARGGGDGPEAVADGLYDVTNLSWRPEAAKISVLISDAPPHGLAPWEDYSFPEGCPEKHDPVEIVRNLTKREITLYSVGCEPSINPYKDFFMALAYLTGGQYIPLSVPKRLIDAIIGGAQEELSLQKFSKDVEEEILRIASIGETVNETVIAESVYSKLLNEGATSKQLFRNNKPLEGASDFAKSLAMSMSMKDVRTTYNESTHFPRPRSSSGRRVFASEYMSAPVMESAPALGSISRAESPAPMAMVDLDFSSSMTDMYASERMPASDWDTTASAKMAEPYIGGGAVVDSSASAGESYSTVESAVSLDQIERLVRKKTAMLAL